MCVYSVMSDSFVTPWTGAYQAPLSTEFPRQEYWSGLPSPGNLPEPEIRPCLLHLLHWQANSLPHLGMFSNTFNWAEAYMTILTEFSVRPYVGQPHQIFPPSCNRSLCSGIRSPTLPITDFSELSLCGQKWNLRAN